MGIVYAIFKGSANNSIILLLSGVAAFSENALYIMILSAPFFTVNLTVYINKNPGVEFKLLFSCCDF